MPHYLHIIGAAVHPLAIIAAGASLAIIARSWADALPLIRAARAQLATLEA